MPWLEGFFPRKSNQSPPDFPHKLKGVEDDLWKEEWSRGVYGFPIPVSDHFLSEGRALAGQHPPERFIHQLGPFIISRSPESHTKAFMQALDFLVPDGTPVVATADGNIVEVVISNTEWGPGPDFSQFMNYITVAHQDGEFSQYCHLAVNSAPLGLTVGSEVKKGMQIAITGKTGWTDRDHLHFMVFRSEKEQRIESATIKNPYGFKSLKPKFEGEK
ncbi:MAG: peptidoglycan DD-metalloendopeptidase family protein [Candidatus Uhrbacteria bacterium]|nr:peptidoglycan DD-metalloendopeptidase family protein [Candidatus Uhrbacteria bacterium]